MGRLIDTDVLKQQDFQDYSISDVAVAIRDCPDGVVYCKDCKHGNWSTAKCYCMVWGGYNGAGIDGFCNYGERSDSE